MSTHTPDPLIYNKPVIETVADGKRQTVASLVTLVRWDDTANGFTDCVPERDATGRLFAAAPAMLAALKLSLQRLSELNRDDEAGMRIVIANAITKAESSQ